MAWCNVVGNFHHGFRVIGPYPTRQHASEASEDIDESVWVVELEEAPPEGDRDTTTEPRVARPPFGPDLKYKIQVQFNPNNIDLILSGINQLCEVQSYALFLPATFADVGRARELYGNDDVEVDDDAGTSPTENGTWVQAWVYVPDSDDDDDDDDDWTEEEDAEMLDEALEEKLGGDEPGEEVRP